MSLFHTKNMFDFIMFLVSVFIIVFMSLLLLGIFVLPYVDVNPILVITLVVAITSVFWFWLFRDELF